MPDSPLPPTWLPSKVSVLPPIQALLTPYRKMPLPEFGWFVPCQWPIQLAKMRVPSHALSGACHSLRSMKMPWPPLPATTFSSPSWRMPIVRFELLTAWRPWRPL